MHAGYTGKIQMMKKELIIKVILLNLGYKLAIHALYIRINKQ